MRWLLLIISLTSVSAWAVQPRCGHDAFGNIVCVDKDGVLSTPPVKPKLKEKTTAPKTEASATAEEKRSKESVNEADTPAERCGTDPFGNTVCR